MGRSEKEACDGAAVEAMRLVLSDVEMDGVVVIGEGEKDAAPMLFNGEAVGTGEGPWMDVAVDPIDGTSLLAYGRPDAIAVIAVAPRGAMWSPGPAHYMSKIVVGRDARAALSRRSLDDPVSSIVAAVAAAKGLRVRDLTVFVLDRPRHAALIAEIQAAGARLVLRTDGDVLGALLAATPGSGVDLLMGIGGTPEGVISACAVRALGGAMIGRLAPQRAPERDAVAAGVAEVRVEPGVQADRGDHRYHGAESAKMGGFCRPSAEERDRQTPQDRLLPGRQIPRAPQDRTAAMVRPRGQRWAWRRQPAVDT